MLPRLKSLLNRTACAVLLTSPFTMARAQPPNQPPAPVVVAPVTRQSVLAEQTFVGTVQPTERATIGSAVDGRVVECPIEEGDRVEDGQMLAQLLTNTIKFEVASAESQLKYNQALLDELKNGTRPEQMEQARARMAAAAARREFAVGRRERLRALAENSSTVTEDEWTEAVATAIEAEQAYAETDAAYEEAEAGPRQEVIAQAEAQVEMQQAVVERLRDQLEKHTIRARFDGYVVLKNTEVGAWVSRGDSVAELVGVDTVEVVVQVVESRVAYVTPGTTVQVVLPALPQSPFEGTVLTTVPQGDLRARTFPVKVAVPNQLTEAGPLIKPGMYARVELPVGTRQEALLVPKDAVVINPESSVVYVIAGDSSSGQPVNVESVAVELGPVYGSQIQVEAELEPGQLVVVEGNERLRPGQQVSVIRTLEPSADSSTAATP